MSNLSSVIDYCRIINGSKGFNDTKTQFINEMVNDYDEAHENAIYRFNVLINTIDAKDVYVNNSTTSIKGIVDTKKKQTATSDMEESLQVYPNMIKQGDYVKFKMNDTDTLQDYIVTSPIEKKHGYDEGVFIKCNQILKWKDKDNVLREYPCVSEDDSYGAKLVKSGNDFIGTTETKTKITVQANEFTKEIGKDTRFIFSHSKEDIYKAVNINRSINEGIITITCDKDLFQNEDNLVDNLAFNDYSSSKVNPTPTTYTITGNDNISMTSNATYTVSSTITGGVWSIDTRMTAYAQITSQTNSQCTIKPLKVGQLFILQYVDSNGNILAKKTINIVR